MTTRSADSAVNPGAAFNVLDDFLGGHGLLLFDILTGSTRESSPALPSVAKNCNAEPV